MTVNLNTGSNAQFINRNQQTTGFFKKESKESVLSKIPIDELTGLVNLPLPKTQMFLDYNYDPSIKKIEDETIIDCLNELCGSEDYFSVIENYSPFERCELIRKLREIGGSIRQIARITGISESLIRRIK